MKGFVIETATLISLCLSLSLSVFVVMAVGSGNAIATTRLNLGRPLLRLGLSKRQQCKPLHKSK